MQIANAFYCYDRNSIGYSTRKVVFRGKQRWMTEKKTHMGYQLAGEDREWREYCLLRIQNLERVPVSKFIHKHLISERCQIKRPQQALVLIPGLIP